MLAIAHVVWLEVWWIFASEIGFHFSQSHENYYTNPRGLSWCGLHILVEPETGFIVILGYNQPSHSRSPGAGFSSASIPSSTIVRYYAIRRP